MTGWLILLSCVLIFVVLFQVTRTLDLVSQLRGDERTTEGMTKFHAILLLIFMVLGIYGFFFCFGHYKNKEPITASEHGTLIEHMFFWTLVVCSTVFIICNILLFTFSYVFRYRKDRQAEHFAHSNKLEFIWTIIPTIVLTALVVFGLQAWTRIMDVADPDDENVITFEMTAQQFFWTSRYPGEDRKLGPTDYSLICADNPVGIITREYVEHRLHTLTDSLPKPMNQWGEIPKLRYRKETLLPKMIDSLQHVIDTSPNKWRVKDAKDQLDAAEDELDKIDGHITVRLKTVERIEKKYTEAYYQSHAAEMTWGYDDFLPSELHLPVNKTALAKIVALDVLHDFDIPDMKVKMDAVPGMPTSFTFKPVKTTEEARVERGKNPEWQNIKEGDTEPRYKKYNYEVACAELCGKGHSSMKYTLVVDKEQDFWNWYHSQPTLWSAEADKLILDHGVSEFAPKMKTAPAATAAADSSAMATDTTAVKPK